MGRRAGGLRFQSSGGARPAALPAGQQRRLRIERLAHDGRGIGFLDGRTWFVSGALPGEEVEARVLAARRQVVEARVERVLVAAALRRPASCAVAGQCGGCSLQHLPHGEQLALKQRTLAEQLQRIARLEPDHWAAALVGPELGYRRRARVAVRWDAAHGRLEVGFRAAASRAIVPLIDCPVLVQPLQTLARALPERLGALERPAAIGHVELFSGTEQALLVRHTLPLTAPDRRALMDFCAAHGAQLWLQGDGQPQPACGTAPLGYRLEAYDLTLHYRPGDFIQVNAPVNAAMVAQALEWLAPRPDERVLDLFCGLGNFSLPLAQRAREVVGVEGVAEMVTRATANGLANGLANLHFQCADLSKPLAGAAWAAGGFPLVLLDPPREGALEVVRQMASLAARRVLYVSCNPATLARDAAELARQGYCLVRAGILDMFPQTAHVEAMALFEKH